MDFLLQMSSKKFKNKKNSCLFLDRDGVINYDYGYIDSFERFDLIPGVLSSLKEISSRNIHIIIITNQSGIARGIFNEDEYMLLTSKILDMFTKERIFISKVYTCPHHPKAKIKKYKKNCNCRKPMPGLILNAIKEFNIDLNKSIFIGDKRSDMEAAINAGIKNIFKIDNGNDFSDDSFIKYNSLKSCYIAENKFKDILGYF